MEQAAKNFKQRKVEVATLTFKKTRFLMFFHDFWILKFSQVLT